MLYKRKGFWHLDATINGIRYRESLKTTDRREASALEKKRISEILAGKAATKTGREFARKPFSDAAKQFLLERKPHVAERTLQFETERLKPLSKHFGQSALIRIRAEQIGEYQRERLKSVSPRTVNMEVSVLRKMLKRGKAWSPLAEDVRMLRESGKPIGRVLTAEDKLTLFEVAGSRPDWLVAFCAAVLAASTTCRGVELKHLRWQDVDLDGRTIAVQTSKTAAGHRLIPLNSDAAAALARLWERSRISEATRAEHYVFPACERGRIDPTHPQKSWRTAWRKIRTAAGKAAGQRIARELLNAGGMKLSAVKAGYRQAQQQFARFRFHDLRHQSITELCEGGASDSTIMALAGHLSRRMMEHYSHVRLAAKRTAVDQLATGLMGKAGA